MSSEELLVNIYSSFTPPLRHHFPWMFPGPLSLWLNFLIYLFGGTHNPTLYLDVSPDMEKAENTGPCALFPQYLAQFLAHSRCSIVPVK